MPGYILSPQAKKSLTQIRDYTLKNFGTRQQKVYMTLLRDKMRSTAECPKKGKFREDIKAGYYSVSVGKHYIYYRIRGDQLEIIDVLHQSMEPHRHI